MQQLLPHPDTLFLLPLFPEFFRRCQMGENQPKIPLLGFFFFSPTVVSPVCFHIRFLHMLTLSTRQDTVPVYGNVNPAGLRD